MIHELVANSWLILEQSVETNIKAFTVEHRLVLTDLVDQNLLVAPSSSFLLIRHLATVVKTTNVSVGNALTLTHSAHPRAKNESVSHFLFMWGLAENNPDWPATKSALNLGQSVDVQVAKGCYSTLELRQEVSFNITRNLSVSQVLSLQSNVAAYKPTKYWTSFDVVVEAP